MESRSAAPPKRHSNWQYNTFEEINIGRQLSHAHDHAGKIAGFISPSLSASSHGEGRASLLEELDDIVFLIHINRNGDAGAPQPTISSFFT
ncbi:MAG: hypothetical protein M2R45_03376 [Verrucomicrobia subdivision 3 bacterium]|nr:hypothetical protein [Limisphaerales bacterium]MCS1416711.1 hypothetical protein [Limisphaerales bacterium]